MRVALFGGTFDPPHRGHLEAALAAANRFALDRVLLAPAGIQPLKADVVIAPYLDRLAMVELVAAEDARLVASTVDAPLASGQPNYTVDTLRKLKDDLRADTELSVIVGADSFLTLRQWKDSEQLLSLARWVVVNRPGFALSQLATLGMSEAQQMRVEVLPDFLVPISATEIRTRLRAGESCAEWLLPAVSEYISRRQLYR